MLTISSKSWHLRLVRSYHEGSYTPKSLCGYFWAVAFAVFLTPFMAALIGVLAVGAVILLLVPQAIFGFLMKWWPSRKTDGPMEFKPHKPNLVWEFIKAKKRRVCPLIKVVEE